MCDEKANVQAAIAPGYPRRRFLDKCHEVISLIERATYVTREIMSLKREFFTRT